MTEPVILLLVGVTLVQLLFGVVMYFDAKRLDLQDPEQYWLGVVVPTIGFVVILYYFSERKNLPKQSKSDSQDEPAR
ncbi:hypothetical protein [Halobellus rarus]|uniref:Uncharacterized protein n=1 Tax=Halobellus rarus TaxID=1126237 RepID=A0ABD6CNG8_9EURY|nr:hypothetical protein [Halobellus rarus]